MPIPIFLITRASPARMKTHKLLLALENEEWYAVTHSDEDKFALMEIGIPLHRIITHHIPASPSAIGEIRDWVQNVLTKPGDWYCMLDDNSEIQKLPSPWYDRERLNFNQEIDQSESWIDFRSLYRTPLLPTELLPLIHEIQQQCIAQKTTYGGLAPEENYYFRSNKWSISTYVRGKFCVVQNDGIPWQYHPDLTLLTDWARTFRCIAQYGSVAVNRFCHPSFTYFQPGGIGTLDERLPYLRQASGYLKREYDGLCAPFKQHDWMIHCKIHAARSIERWRIEHGFV